jgi:TnpA family transposase
LGSYSRKNKLYQAIRQLGRAIRTEYLLGYVADEQLRSTVLVAMNKNESFNHFTQWLAFGREGVIAENNRTVSGHLSHSFMQYPLAQRWASAARKRSGAAARAC